MDEQPIGPTRYKRLLMILAASPRSPLPEKDAPLLELHREYRTHIRLGDAALKTMRYEQAMYPNEPEFWHSSLERAMTETGLALKLLQTIGVDDDGIGDPYYKLADRIKDAEQRLEKGL